MDKLMEIVIDCVSASGNLILVVLGFYLIYGVMKVINMAHGEMVMLGSYLAATVSQVTGHFWLGAVTAMLSCFLLGMLIEQLIIRRLYEKDNVMTLLATWGVSLVLMEAIRLIYGPSGLYVDPPFNTTLKLFGVPTLAYNFVILGAAMAVFVTLIVILQYSGLGIRLKAAIENPVKANLFKVNVRWIYAVAFGAGTGIAGLAGALISPTGAITPQMGTDYAFLSFLVVICGGFRSIYSPVIGAVVIASSRVLLNSYLGATTSTMGILLIVLLIVYLRPGGLNPEKT